MKMSLITGNEQNSLSNSYRSTLIEPIQILNILKILKTTSMEDDCNVRRSQKLGISGNEQKFIKKSHIVI
jgi:hypothetical protein